jgi:Lrp/AsnC family transcriptional regulator, leucine-responsive regulatory protein
VAQADLQDRLPKGPLIRGRRSPHPTAIEGGAVGFANDERKAHSLIPDAHEMQQSVVNLSFFRTLCSRVSLLVARPPPFPLHSQRTDFIMAPRRRDIDQLALKILQLLLTDARQSQRVIAKALGVKAASTIGRHIEKMEQNGTITRFTCHLNYERLYEGTMVFAKVKVKQHLAPNAEDFIKKISALAEVIEVYAVTDSGDYLIKVLAPSNADCRWQMRCADSPGFLRKGQKVDQVGPPFPEKSMRLQGSAQALRTTERKRPQRKRLRDFAAQNNWAAEGSSGSIPAAELRGRLRQVLLNKRTPIFRTIPRRSRRGVTTISTKFSP